MQPQLNQVDNKANAPLLQQLSYVTACTIGQPDMAHPGLEVILKKPIELSIEELLKLNPTRGKTYREGSKEHYEQGMESKYSPPLTQKSSTT